MMPKRYLKIPKTQVNQYFEDRFCMRVDPRISA
jgi:hypothetical protein